MLDRDDEQIVKDAKEAGAVIVTWDRVLREAAGGITPYEALDKAQAEGRGNPEAQAELSRLRTLSPRDLSVLCESADKTLQMFREELGEPDELFAKMVRVLRVQKGYSWRAIARHCSEYWEAPFGANQIAGMVICEKAAAALGEDFMQPPWN